MQVVFESVIFLFLVHPYDVGDGIILANSTEFLIVSAAPHRACSTSWPSSCCSRSSAICAIMSVGHVAEHASSDVLHGLPIQVEEIALYNTTFRKLDGGIVMFSNALIASTGFSNLSRSGLHNESFKVRTAPCRRQPQSRPIARHTDSAMTSPRLRPFY